MNSPHKTAANLRHAFQSLDLRGKIAIALLGAMFILGAVVTLPTYFVARHLLTEHSHALLGASGQFAGKDIELKLKSLLGISELLACNQLIANVANNSAARGEPIDALLQQKMTVEGAVLTLVNRAGQSLASSSGVPPDFEANGLLTAALRSGSAQSRLLSPGEATASLLLALPVRQPLNGKIAGGLLLRVPLAALLPRENGTYQQWLTSNDERVLGERAASDAFEVATPLAFAPPLAIFNLQLHQAQARNVALNDLNILLVIFTLCGLAIVIGMLVFARFGARFITKPLDEVVLAAEGIAATGLPVSRLPVRRGDEFGRLSAAFNTMVDRLAESQADLEQRVAERTREYEESQHDTERANRLLHEAVSSFSQGFTIYDENDCLVLCNEAYLSLYEASRDLIVTGASFEEIVRKGAERGQYSAAKDNVDTWVKQRVSQHQHANGEIIEQQLSDGRWLLVVEYRTPSGYIVGNRIDITELKRTSEALRQRELYLQATLDNLPFLFWLKDPQSRFLAVNQRFADACGQPSPEAIIGLTDFDVWPQALAESYRQDDFAVMASRREKLLEEPVAGAGGADWIETYKKPVLADDGSVLGTVGFARDISQRKHMEQALLDGEQRWELAVNGANDGIWDWSPTTGKVFFSDRWKSMLGYAPDDLSGSFDDWDRLIHPDDREYTYAALERHLSGEDAFYQCEHRLRCKDGSYKWILDRGQAQFDANGNALRMAGSHTDITERRAADALIRDRNEQLNAIFDLSPEGFVSFDTERRVKYASPAFLALTGLEEQALTGLDEASFDQRLAQLCVAQARFPGLSELRAMQRKHLETGLTQLVPQRQVIEMAGPGKRVLEIGLRLATGETVSQILYLRDITHESEVDRIKTEFLSTAAHELRTPMASIYGFTELLLNEEFDESDRRDFLDTIYRQSALMIAILNELLDLSRIEARRGKDFRIERLDLHGLLADVVTGFKPPAGRTLPMQIRSASPASDALYVRADRNKLTQAISNVLSNAYKYSPEGGAVELTLLADPVGNQPAGCVGIRITDHGIGMTAAQLERICERFYRADSSGKIPGTGLGMSIVKEIVELHSGALQFASKPGAGTSITLWIPIATEGGGKP